MLSQGIRAGLDRPFLLSCWPVRSLGSTSLRGVVKTDATKHSFFKHVIEQRAANESKPALYYWLKILANSGSYGWLVVLNPNEAAYVKLKVFSGEDSSKQPRTCSKSLEKVQA
jgi:hypothetical protein